MPYIKKICKAGPVIETEKTYSSRYGRKGIKRGNNMNPTPEDVAKVNERIAETKLRRLIYANFKQGDWHLTLTYRVSERPGPEQAKKYLQRFLDRMRKYFNRKLKKQLTYIIVTEYENTAIHHHMLIPSVDLRDIVALWPYGAIRSTSIRDIHHLTNIAHYLIKETRKTFRSKDSANKHRWNGSKNLIKPKIITEIVPARTWSNIPRPIKGYYLDKDSVRTDVHIVTGYPYMFYRMISLKR